MRLIITGVARTCTLPLPTRGAVCSSPTSSSARPVIPGFSAPNSIANGIRMRPRAPAGLRLLLGVVLLAVDAPALAVLLALEAPLLVGTDLSVCAGARLRCIVACLAALEPGRFPVCQLPRCHALLDAPLLV